MKTTTVTIEGIDGSGVEEMIYDDDVKPIDCGVGFVELHQTNGKDFYRAIVLARVTYNIPNTSANTRGESVEWQTQEALVFYVLNKKIAHIIILGSIVQI